MASSSPNRSGSEDGHSAQLTAPETPPTRASTTLTVVTAKKKCNCKNSRCLKLYCDCFAAGLFCDDCNCVGCCNNEENEELHKAAVTQILERNPSAFTPKIAPSPDPTSAKHNRGCKCKKSGCLKKYCECFQAGIVCGENCICCDCKNFEGSSKLHEVTGGVERPPPERRTLASTLPSPAKSPQVRKKPVIPSPPMRKAKNLWAKSAANMQRLQLPDIPPELDSDKNGKMGSAETVKGEDRGKDGRFKRKRSVQHLLQEKVLRNVCDLLLSAAQDLDWNSSSANEKSSDGTQSEGASSSLKREDSIVEGFSTCVGDLLECAKKAKVEAKEGEVIRT